ncbi:uncharacterized protein METZ01_LOCUS122176 [marine metagenome]|uniref:Methyltransferase domain-containing protein n=1 Tax=marine metagenome TaxID=408172 RepID=A0A381XXY1_9ZZZZ
METYSSNFVERLISYGTWLGEFIRFLAIRAYAGYHIRYRALNKEILLLLNESNRVLDVGCGVGDHILGFARKFPNNDFVGIDIDSAAISNARIRATYRKLNNIQYHELNCLKMKFQSQFDLIYTVDMLEHVDDVATVILNIRNALKPDGFLVLHVPHKPQHRILKRLKKVKDEEHVRIGFSAQDLSTLLHEYHFQILSLKYTHGPLGAFAWELSYLSRHQPLLAVLLVPLIQILCIGDHIVHNKRGNGVLLVAKR